jgi:hypothetical protein
MMERYKGYWITGSAVPGPPYTHYWESFGTILKDGRLGSVVEVVRFRDTGIRFDPDLRGLAEFYGMEISRIAVDHLLPPE